MSKLALLRATKTRPGLASLLGYKTSAIAYILYQVPAAAKYKSFDIPKKKGGSRTIDAPIPQLKGLQRRLADLLYECLRDIEETEPRKNKVSHAFREGFSIISNAQAHRNRRYVLNLDLKDFFPTLNFGRVRGFFLHNKHFKLAEPVATQIAQIACNDGKLPQGSPCSPILSELLTHFLDMRLIRLAARSKCSYTRYADDITFSTNQKAFPEALAVASGPSWALGDELKSRIADAGFIVNDPKTRMQVRASRQSVTGLIVNRKVNIAQSYYKLARAMTNTFLSTGTYTRDAKPETSVQRLEGIVNHIYHIKERLIDIRIAKEPNKDRQDRLHKERTKSKNENPSAIRQLYYRLVFFKHFMDPPKPLILCEGPTDSVYLKSAIRKLIGGHPKLGVSAAGKVTLSVNFFRYSKQSRDILQLRGGSGDLKFFIEHWKEDFGKFKYRPTNHPIIVMIDNDDGANGIFGLLKGKLFGVTIAHDIDLPFCHLHGPLYLVKTPVKGPNHKSCPEDFFDPAVRATKIDGKSFNPSKEHDAPGEYGKVVFAGKVIRPNASTIDFSGFDPILSRIEAVIDDYAKRKSAVTKAPPAAAVSATLAISAASAAP